MAKRKKYTEWSNETHYYILLHLCHTFKESKIKYGTEKKFVLVQKQFIRNYHLFDFPFCSVLLLKIECNISWKLEMIFFPLGRQNSTWTILSENNKKKNAEIPDTIFHADLGNVRPFYLLNLNLDFICLFIELFLISGMDEQSINAPLTSQRLQQICQLELTRFTI